MLPSVLLAEDAELLRLLELETLGTPPDLGGTDIEPDIEGW